MTRAYRSVEDFAKLDYIEGHFTSTHLGDKTEIQSITRVLQGASPIKKRIPVGSVKWNIGHCLETAGASGLLKVVLSMKHETIPQTVDPSLPLNKDVDWKNVPVFPPSVPLAWKTHHDGTPRCSGVNAFGIGGLNVHLAVQEYLPDQKKTHVSVSFFPESPAAAVTTLKTTYGNIDDMSTAVVGTGLILPGASCLTAFRNFLRSSQRAIRAVPVKPWDTRIFSDHPRLQNKTIDMPGAGVIENFEYDWKTHGIPPKQLLQASPLQFMILDAVDQALNQAKFDLQNEELLAATGCIVGTSFGGDFSTQLIMGLKQPETCELLTRLLMENGFSAEDSGAFSDEFQKVFLRHMPALIDETGSFTSSALASRITKSFNLKGGGVAVESGDVSDFAALLCALDMLQTRQCNAMICIAGQHDLTPGLFQELSLSGRLASSRDFAAPYDTSSQGILPGDPKEIETFLISFVVDQTGYPPDFVTLDADFESLNIDSIKKAQMFGEIGEYFDVRADSDLTLDDFTTLRNVRDFLLKNI